jgi:hypothetical protein
MMMMVMVTVLVRRRACFGGVLVTQAVRRVVVKPCSADQGQQIAASSQPGQRTSMGEQLQRHGKHQGSLGL